MSPNAPIIRYYHAGAWQLTPPDYRSLPPRQARENRVMAVVDAEGYVMALVLTKHEEDDQFMTFMHNTRAPVDPSIIQMPPGYTLNPDGSYTRVVSHEGVPVAQITVTHEPR